MAVYDVGTESSRMPKILIIDDFGGFRRFFCFDDEPVTRGLARFIAAALKLGNPAIVWATESHRQGIPRELKALGVDVEAALQNATYTAYDANEPPDLVRLSEAIRRANEAALKAGNKHPRVSICGERAGFLWAERRIDEALRLERRVNELVQRYDIDVLCTYPLPKIEDDFAFRRLRAEHSSVSYC